MTCHARMHHDILDEFKEWAASLEQKEKKKHIKLFELSL